MSQNHNELYKIFGYAFQMLDNPSCVDSKNKIADEIVKLLDILKTTLVDCEAQQQLVDGHRGDFYRWLALRIFAIVLDGSSSSTTSIFNAFLDIVRLRSSFDPSTLTEILDIFVDAARRLSDSNGKYLRRSDEPIIVSRCQNVESRSIDVGSCDKLRTTYRFLVDVVDRCCDVIGRLDQIYAFEILNLFVQIFNDCDDQLKSTVLNVVPRLMCSVMPNNCLEWDAFYDCLFMYYDHFYRSQTVENSFFDNMKTIITYITSLNVTLSQNICEIMFILTLESAYNLSNSEYIDDWVRLSIRILGEPNFKIVDFDLTIHRFIGPNYLRFVPLIESYILKTVEADLGLATEVRIVDKSSIWKSCCVVLDQVPKIAYRSTLFEQLLNYSSSLITSGRRLGSFLSLKYPKIRFEFFEPHNLRPLSAVPFIFDECLGDFDSTKCQSLANYVTVVLDLVFDLKTPKFDDAHLLEHIFLLFFLPWTDRYSDIFSVSTKLVFLNGLSNLMFLATPEKMTKFVSIFLRRIFDTVQNDAELSNECMSVVILLLYRIRGNLTTEIVDILKDRLMPDKIRDLLANPDVGPKLICFLSNRCVLSKTFDKWEIRCVDCDAAEGDLIDFGLIRIVAYVALKFVHFLQIEDNLNRQLIKCYSRFCVHSSHLRTADNVRLLIKHMINDGLNDKVLINDTICRLAYDNGRTNDEIVNVIWSTLCSILSNLNGERQLASILEITKKLLTVQCPDLMVILKILCVYYLSKNVDVCAVRSLFKIALSSRQLDFNGFCKNVEPQLAKFMVDFTLYKVSKDVDVGTSFAEITNVLGFKIDAVTAGTTLMSSVLTEIVKMCPVSQSSIVLAELSNLFSTDLKTFVDKHYENVFCAVYCLDDSTAVRHLIDLLNYCDLGLETTLYWKYSQLVCKLILNSKRPLKIFRFLIHSKIGVETVDDQLAALKQHFVGCLTVIESTLPNSPPLSVARKYITAISTLIDVLGTEIVASIQVKLLTTLRTCLPLYYDVLPERCLKVWVRFCFSVDVLKIGPYLSTIVVHLLPLFDKFPEMVSNICHYLVVDNGVHFKEQLPLLYFVPCYPTVKMQRVWCVIQSSLLNKGHYVRDLLSTIENIYCDSVETKIVALERLRHCIDGHSSSLTSALTMDELHPIFEMVVTCLLDNASNKNLQVKTLCAINLGELGAVDPLKFGFNDGSKSYSPQKYDLTADDFSVICLTKIVHCLGKYDDSKIVSMLYGTIQELLKIQFAQKNDDDKCKYFAKFSVQDQHILHPLLQSKYIFKGIKMDKGPNPITFGLHTVKTPSEWAALWASQMLSRMPASLSKTIFNVCLPAMFVDLDVTETVLPYILLYALIDCAPSDVDLIEKEMKYILRWDVSKHRTKPDNVMTIVGQTSKTVVHSDVSQTKYVAVILDLLNFLEQATSDRFFFGAELNAASQDVKIEERIADFLSRFPNRAMSRQAFVQNDYTRSLYYFEKSSSDETSSNLKPLRNIYSKLNDVDGLVGVTKSSTVAPTTEEMIVNHTVSGALQSAIAGYERLCVKYQSTNVYRGLIQCYININQPITALAVSKQIVEDTRYLKPDIFSERVEAAWNSLQRDDQLDEFDSKFMDGRSWSVDLVNIFRLLTRNDYSVVLDKLKSIRLGIVNRLTDLNRNGMHLYRTGYWYMVKLHILNDVEYLSQKLFSLPKQGAILNVDFDHFERRLSLLPSHGPYAGDVRKTHLQTLDVFLTAAASKLSSDELDKFKRRLGAMWLNMSKRARTNKNVQGSYTCIGIAGKYEPPQLFIELAKYYQSINDTEGAVLTLQQGLVQKDVDRKIRAKAKLLTASFNVGNMNLDFNDGYTAFKEAAETYNLEKSFVSLASYLYRQHLTENEPDNTAAKRFIQIDSARNFSKSLLYGRKHVYQSMPCLLSLWLDYGARVAIKSKKSNDGITATLFDFNSLMENNLSCLPTAVFVTAFSQILSRINHRQSTCFDILKAIIVRIVKEHHRQALWSFVGVCRSTNPMQKKRAEEICRIVKNGDAQLSTYFNNFNALVDKLVEISSKKLKYSRKVTLTQICPALKTVIDASRSSPVMLPLQKFLTVNVCDNDDSGPFMSNPVTIVDIKNEVLMLHSAQMPLRLEFVGSDGEIYPLLCKKDDLRLDSRIMEFNSVINGLLRRDASSCEKGLSIRTYGVVPLNAECGVIEWLSGLTSLKGLVTDMYSKLGTTTMPMTQIKKLMLVQKGEVDISERLRRYVKVILPKHPPVLHKWFFERHPSPDDWYHCRSAFVKSSAVMSIVGYIVGLGDRHGENILIDSKSGEAVHVDFNCMFNRSDLLYYPETVPFRLTHSMVRAMGSTGVEGPFLISCEATNRVMRHHSEQLLSVMKPFLYDLDVKTARRTNRESSDVLDDQSNDEAKINIRNVEMRLNGVVRCKNDQWAPHRNTKPLSVEGQTRMLIKEATNEVNLCQMFAGWAPYM